jgi:hypothetical protein
MKRLALCCLVLTAIASLPNVASAAPKTGSNLKSVAHVVAFPFRHTAATIEGFLYGGLKVVGSVVDVVERGAAAVHAGVSKVDETIDKVEDVVVPPAAGLWSVPNVGRQDSPANVLAIPGCTAKAFVPKGCYAQTLADLAEVRCPGQTFKFRCLASPESPDLRPAGPVAPGESR